MDSNFGDVYQKPFVPYAYIYARCIRGHCIPKSTYLVGRYMVFSPVYVSITYVYLARVHVSLMLCKYCLLLYMHIMDS